MRPFVLMAAILTLAAPVALAKTPAKKKKPNAYNASEFIKKKEAKAPAVADSAKKDGKQPQGATGGLQNFDCQVAETSPTAPPSMTERPVEKTTDEKAAVNTTEQAIEMAKTVARTVADNCRSKAAAPEVKPDVGVSVSNPEGLGAKETPGDRPELSGTVGVKATF